MMWIGYSDPNKDRSVLKDLMGRYRTNIFLEFNKSAHDEYPPLYSMREGGWAGLPSAYEIYMTSDSEYEAAMKLVGSWTHWSKLIKSKPFLKGSEDGGSWTGLEAWRAEKEIRDKALAYNQLKISAATGNVTAQKIIFDGDKKTAASKRGRPSDAEIKKAAAAQAEESAQVKSDLQRIKDLDGQSISRKAV